MSSATAAEPRSLGAPLHRTNELLVTRSLCGLADQHPGHVQIAGQQIKIMKITKQSQPAAARLGKPVGVQTFRLTGRMRPIPGGERPNCSSC